MYYTKLHVHGVPLWHQWKGSFSRRFVQRSSPIKEQDINLLLYSESLATLNKSKNDCHYTDLMFYCTGKI